MILVKYFCYNTESYSEKRQEFWCSIICMLSFKENSDKESNKHRYDPFKDIVLCSRDFFTQLSVELSNFFLNIRNLLTSSENREVKVSGFKKGFNEHFSLLFIKAS